MTPHEEWYTQSPGSRTVSSSDYHAKCAECAAKDQQITTLTAERDKWQNEVCTAKDHLPVDLEEDSLSVGITKLRDTIKSLQAKLEKMERAKYGTPCRCEEWITAARKAEDECDTLRATVTRLEVACAERFAEAEEVHSQNVGLRKDLASAHADVRAVFEALRSFDQWLNAEDARGGIRADYVSLDYLKAWEPCELAMDRPTVRKIVEGT